MLTKNAEKGIRFRKKPVGYLHFLFNKVMQ